jgi:hypothetical protein
MILASDLERKNNKQLNFKYQNKALKLNHKLTLLIMEPNQTINLNKTFNLQKYRANFHQKVKQLA